MGEQIRKARGEAGLSQKELADQIYRRQTTLSDIENGKIEVPSGTLALLAAFLDKPIAYFYPPYLYRKFPKSEELEPLDQELLIHFHDIYGDNLKELAINLVRVLGNFDPKDTVIELLPLIKEKLDQERITEDLLEKARQKRKGKKGI